MRPVNSLLQLLLLIHDRWATQRPPCSHHATARALTAASSLSKTKSNTMLAREQGFLLLNNGGGSISMQGGEVDQGRKVAESRASGNLPHPRPSRARFPPQPRSQGEQRAGRSPGSPGAGKVTPGSQSRRRWTRDKYQARPRPEVGNEEPREERLNFRSEDCEPDLDSGGVKTQHQAHEGNDAGSNVRRRLRACQARCSRGRTAAPEHGTIAGE